MGPASSGLAPRELTVWSGGWSVVTSSSSSGKALRFVSNWWVSASLLYQFSFSPRIAFITLNIQSNSTLEPGKEDICTLLIR